MCYAVGYGHEVWTAGDYQDDVVTELLMQNDGNLVLYNTAVLPQQEVIWQSGDVVSCSSCYNKKTLRLMRLVSGCCQNNIEHWYGTMAWC